MMKRDINEASETVLNVSSVLSLPHCFGENECGPSRPQGEDGIAKKIQDKTEEIDHSKRESKEDQNSNESRNVRIEMDDVESLSKLHNLNSPSDEVEAILQNMYNKEYKLYKCKENTKNIRPGETNFNWKSRVQVYLMEPVPSEGPPLEYDPKSRNGFVKLVFTILLVMLVVTALFTIAVIHVTTLKRAFKGKAGLVFMIIGTIGFLVMSYVMACSACSRKPPCNYICLVLAVIFMSLVVAWICVYSKTELAIYAVIGTSCIVVVCLLLACTSYDFTKWLTYAVIAVAVIGVFSLMFFGIRMITGEQMKTVHAVILLVSLVVISFMFIIELQMVLGGKAVEISEDDYAFAAFLLYSSIIDIFLKLLQLLSILDD